ncbi:MAG: Na+/H+ antiporter NhaA [Fimbriimonadaceae bacterium]|nr:Na+/H+ antiporter NhaA [Fimbriimonadaceae bacterium]
MRVHRSPVIERVVRPFQAFAEQQAAGGVVLVVATLVAMLLANSAWAGPYFDLLQSRFGLQWAGYTEGYPVITWVNDGLMAVFFLAVGLEIKREMVAGELSSVGRAMVPMAAALGGMAVPALVYSVVCLGTPETKGWGVPMATDIAFALGVLALLGDRVPTGLKVFLAALAIVDDIGAVVVIALFYAGSVKAAYLFAGLAVWVVMVVGGRLGVRWLGFYGVLGLVLWWLTHHSGVHATVAGVLTAFAVPARARIDVPEFLANARQRIEEISGCQSDLLDESQESSLQMLERSAERVTTPLNRWLHLVHPWVVFLIVPLFALANAGLPVDAARLSTALGHHVFLGVFLGLLLGKPLGIFVATWVAVKAFRLPLPGGVTFRHVFGASLLGGIGFTMSFFVAGLAFPGTEALTVAKLSVLVTSVVAGLAGAGFLAMAGRRTGPARA